MPCPPHSPRRTDPVPRSGPFRELSGSTSSTGPPPGPPPCPRFPLPPPPPIRGASPRSAHRGRWDPDQAESDAIHRAAGPGTVRPGSARLGSARPGTARLGSGWAGHGPGYCSASSGCRRREGAGGAGTAQPSPAARRSSVRYSTAQSNQSPSGTGMGHPDQNRRQNGHRRGHGGLGGRRRHPEMGMGVSGGQRDRAERSSAQQERAGGCWDSKRGTDGRGDAGREGHRDEKGTDGQEAPGQRDRAGTARHGDGNTGRGPRRDKG